MSKFPIEDRRTQIPALLPVVGKGIPTGSHAAAFTGAEEARPNRALRSISGFFRWYRDSVLKPETEAEKAEWQKNSF